MKDLEDWTNKLIKVPEIARMLYVKRFFCSDKNAEEVLDLGVSKDSEKALGFSSGDPSYFGQLERKDSMCSTNSLNDMENML